MKGRFFAICLMVLSLAVHGQNSLLWQDFEGAQGQTPPLGWSIQLIAGQSSLDSFTFDDELYFLTPPIKGQYALFDSYKGGQLIGTNGNGMGEEVGLLSPWVKDLPSSDLQLSCAYHFVRYSKATFHIDIQTDTGSWSTIWSTAKSTVYSTDVQLDLNAYAGEDSLRIRFRWRNGETLPNQGLLAVDQIHLFQRKTLDISANILEEVAEELIPNQLFHPILELKNTGKDTAWNIPVSLRLGGIKSSIYTDTLALLPPGQLARILTSGILLDTTGILTMVFRSLLNDSLPINDSATRSYTVLNKPSAPVLSADTLCGPGKTFLRAVQRSGELTIWSDSSSILGIGSPVLSPWLDADRVFSGGQSRFSARMNSTYQGAMRRNGNPTGGSYFSIYAKDRLSIDSFQQHCAYQSQNVRVKLYYRKGHYRGVERQSSEWELLHTDTQDALGWGSYITVPVAQQFLDSGQWHSFYLTVEGGASPTFHADSFYKEDRDMILRSDAMNPFAFGGILSPYSWNGRVYYKRLSQVQEDTVRAVVQDLPSGSQWVEGRGNEGQFKSGALNDPDIASSKEKMVYEITAPSGYAWSDHGSKWLIQSIDLSADQGHIVAPSDTQMRWAANGNLELSFIPDAGWEGHHLLMQVKIGFTEGECDTLLQRRVRVAPTPKIIVESRTSCEGDTSLFISHSTISTGSLQQYWYFSATDSVKASAAAFRFPGPGTYPIRLRLITDQGVEADTLFMYTVHARPQVSFSAENACIGLPIQLTNTTPLDSTTYTAKWEFSDGDSAQGQQVLHAFNSAGSHLVRLRITTAFCEGETEARVYQFERPEAQILAKGHCTDHPIALTDLSRIADGSALGRKWLLPDGSDLLTSQQILYVPKQKGWTSIGLLSQSQFNCTDTAWVDIHVDPSPVADFSFEIACDRLPTDFLNTSTVPSGHSNTYLWKMDGQEWTSEQLIYQFDEPGQTTLELIAWATNGCLDTTEQVINIGRQPVAAFDHEGQCSGEAVQFVNLTSNTVGSIDFVWRFGDGDSSTDFAPEHLYQVTEDSSFLLQLTARAGNGCQTTVERLLTIGAAPVCGFAVQRSKADRQLFTFEPFDTTYASYTWRFGTDGQSFARVPTHRFTHPEETYNVSLEIETDHACLCELSQEVTTSWPLSIQDMEKEPMQLWPNPSTGLIWIQLAETGTNELVQIQVLDVLGQVVWATEVQSGDLRHSLDLSELSAGQYTLALNQAKGHFRTVFQIIH